MDFSALNQFAIGMVDKATALRKGNPQPNMALFARFPPYGREGAGWIAKQALDAGLMGVIFNGIDTPEQALLAVQNMRYPQKRTSKVPEPARTARLRPRGRRMGVGHLNGGVRAARGCVAAQS